MKINIITPCSRPENLEKISESINIPSENYRWIVVFDSDHLHSAPENCESYFLKVDGSNVGNAQRNFAIDMIDDGYVYFLDDDTILHPVLWENLKEYEDKDMIVFSQIWKNGKIRLRGDRVAINHTDSGNFLVKRYVIGDLRWDLRRYDADGIFAEECFKASKSVIFLYKPCSIYNALR
jgi:hypothetical protein